MPDGEFPANMYPWLAAAQSRGYGVHVVPLRDGVLDEDALLAALERPGVRALSVSWVGFSSGVAAISIALGAACRTRDIYFVVDAIQGLGALTLDVKRTPVDILACGGQKWLLSPWGTGFTYVRRAVFESVTPQPVSWMGVRDSDDFSRLADYDLTWRDDARRFEQVTLPYQDFAGHGGEPGAAARARRRRRFLAHPRVRASPARWRAGARNVRSSRRMDFTAASPRSAPGTRSPPARDSTPRVIHSVREGTIRLAPHCYTNDDDRSGVGALRGEPVCRSLSSRTSLTDGG